MPQPRECLPLADCNIASPPDLRPRFANTRPVLCDSSIKDGRSTGDPVSPSCPHWDEARRLLPTVSGPSTSEVIFVLMEKHLLLARHGQLRCSSAVLLVLCCVLCSCQKDDTQRSNEPIQKRALGHGLNVLFVSIDTTRADHLGCYGHPVVRTPNIDRLANEGVRFEQCISSCPITLPSHSTMFTGVYSFVHGVRDNGTFKLAEENHTLAEQFRKAGYATHAQIAAHVLDAKYGLNQGFDTYAGVATTQSGNGVDKSQIDLPNMSHAFNVRTADEITRAGIKLLEENRDQKFFIFLHYFDPHFPYVPPEPYASEYAEPYGGEIAFVDHEFGKLISALRDLGLDRKTLVILTSDHGESLGEHNEETHAFFVYDATLHVPLILWCPDHIDGGGTVRSQVRLLDLAPTIVDFVGLDMPGPIQGKSLLPQIDNDQEDQEDQRPCYGESLSCQHTFGYSALRFLRTGGWKYIHSPDPELYHIAEDPGELNDLIDTDPARAANMKQQLRSIIAQSPEPPGNRANRASTGTEDIARLQSLGYLSSGSHDSGGGFEIDAFQPRGPNPRDRIDVINAMVTALGLFMQNEHAKSETVFRGVLQREPNNAAATRGLLYTLLAQQRPDEAVRSLRRIAETHPNGEGLRSIAGTFAGLLVKENKHAEAVQQFRIALKDKPNDPRLLESLATSLEKLSNDDEALKVYERITQIEPMRPGIYSRWANLLDRMDRHAGAIAILREGRAVQPNNAFLANNLAWRLATSPRQNLRDGEEAVRMAELANKLYNGKHVNLLNTLGAAYASVGRFPDAIASSEQALALAREANDQQAIDTTLGFIRRFKSGQPIDEPATDE
jgi:arylsulfatase A-like enzyme/Flp pilus assembly protein TadD